MGIVSDIFKKSCRRALYCIVAMDSGHGNTWSTQKGYSDVIELDCRLASTEPHLQRLQLPEKGRIGLRHYLDIGDFNEKRLSSIQQYFAHFASQLNSLADSHSLSQFLEDVAIVNLAQLNSQANSSPSLSHFFHTFDTGSNSSARSPQPLHREVLPMPCRESKRKTPGLQTTEPGQSTEVLPAQPEIEETVVIPVGSIPNGGDNLPDPACTNEERSLMFHAVTHLEPKELQSLAESELPVKGQQASKKTKGRFFFGCFAGLMTISQ